MSSRAKFIQLLRQTSMNVAQLQELRHHVNDLLTLNHGFYNEAENARDGDDMLKYRKFIGQCEMGIQIIDLLLGYIAGRTLTVTTALASTDHTII